MHVSDIEKIPANGPREKLLDSLPFESKLRLNFSSPYFRNYYATFFTNLRRPLFGLVRNQLKTCGFISLPQDIETRLSFIDQFSQLLIHSFEDSAIFKQWLKNNPSFFTTLKQCLLLPSNYSRTDAETECNKLTQFHSVYDVVHGSIPSGDPWPEADLRKLNALKLNISIDDFLHVQDFDQATIIFERIYQKIFSSISISDLVKVMIDKLDDNPIKQRLIKASDTKNLEEIIKRDLMHDLFSYCVKKFYTIDFKPYRAISYAVKETIQKLQIPSNATVQTFSPSASSCTNFAVGIMLKTEKEAEDLYTKLASIGIESRKGKIKDQDKWSVQIKDYFPAELINGFCSFKKQYQLTAGSQ